MPSVGIAMEEGVLLRWLKHQGDEVGVDEPIAEIETDKSNLEIPSPAAGRLGPLLYEEGSTVPVTTVITTVIEPSDQDVPLRDDSPAVDRPSAVESVS